MFPDHGLDPDRLLAWFTDAVDATTSSLEISRLAGGHSSGAWRIDVSGPGPTVPMVLKAPEQPSVVFRRDACREARILDAVNRMGGPVPAIVAIDTGTH